ncbi:murein transglycosylase [Synechococcales cyanobacterium C]|uniref:peptidoglycan lytic exotransglycosylase n=1 Tax=Petrachloros mirabilis ULC683 TaxID=2781853 RepID=A0A8K1ZW31_9CYAN|nr:MltA domain-containing protein [Petrachloros mirabilis]NCJ05943.1 murein transglycosylase [Petrachloros mirabilis ULC683]
MSRLWLLKFSTAVLLSGAIALSATAMTRTPLRVIPTAQLPEQAGLDDRLWERFDGSIGDKSALISAIEYSLRYLGTPKAEVDYRHYPVPGVSRDRVLRSLRRFRDLLQKHNSSQSLAAAVRQEFTFYEAIGTDGQGTVEFTGYYEPTYTASRVRTHEYRYPLYRAPANFAQWSQPHPTRAELEGKDGLQAAQGRLRGLELVWLRDRLEAFLIQVQGSARLNLIGGGVMSVGYAGKTNHPYTSIGRELVNAGLFTLEELSLPLVIQHFQDHPQDMEVYLPRNKSFVFFRETHGAPATGSLGVPVTAERSIATDKSLMPPGGLALVYAQVPDYNPAGKIELPWVSRFVLDQDTGSAIKGPGRVDLFMGTGTGAKERAGLINSAGRLYYLLLKE